MRIASSNQFNLSFLEALQEALDHNSVITQEGSFLLYRVIRKGKQSEFQVKDGSDQWIECCFKLTTLLSNRWRVYSEYVFDRLLSIREEMSRFQRINSEDLPFIAAIIDEKLKEFSHENK